MRKAYTANFLSFLLTANGSFCPDVECTNKCVRGKMLLHGHYTEGGSVWLWSWPKSLVLATYFLEFPHKKPLIYCAIVRHIAHGTEWTQGRDIRGSLFHYITLNKQQPQDIVLLCFYVLQSSEWSFLLTHIRC